MNEITGAYEVHPEVDEGALKIFNKALEHHAGMDYKPVAVATQVVNGVNYIFICTGKAVVLHPETKLYAVKIYFKADGKDTVLELQEIKEIDIAKLV